MRVIARIVIAINNQKISDMKTIEEKAKAYDSIIEKANKMHSENCDACKACIEELIPELTESEDEKVRKELIKHLKELSAWKEDEVLPVKNPSYYRQWAAWLEKQGQVKESFISQHENRTCEENGNSLTSEDEKVRKALLELVHDTTGDELWIDYNVHKEEALDWLERQGEHANFRNKIQVGDKVTRNENGVLVNLSQLRRVAKPSEKQCGQKFEMKTAEESLGIDSDTYNKIVDECIFGEPKTKENNGNIGGISSNWSVEDEQHIDSLLKRLDALCRIKLERTRFAISEDIDWLKSLKDRVGCEAKCTTTKEWSEEDEEILRTILSDGIRGAELDMLQVNWLKSLRHQSRWKPSELQLECLSDAIEYYNSFGYPAPKLKELLDDLKKLKGEV